MSIPDRMTRTAVRLLRHGIEDYAGRALRLAQRGADRTALGIETAEPRLAALTDASLRMTEVSCRCVDRLVKAGIVGARGALADGTDRLRMAARAGSLADLYDTQRATLPASRRRIAKEIEAAWKIVASTGRELAEIAQSTGRELLGEARPKTAPRRRGRASARKSGRAAHRRAAPPAS